MSSNKAIRKTRIFTKKRSIFRHFAWKREEMIPQRHKTSSIFCLLCFQAAYEIWSRSEHVLGLDYALLSNLQNRKFHRNPLKISLSKNTSFTYWLISRNLAMTQLWFRCHIFEWRDNMYYHKQSCCFFDHIVGCYIFIFFYF